jgi:hypothetical protein
MQKFFLYSFMVFLAACGGTEQAKTTAEAVADKKDSCYCNSNDNLNLISDSQLATRRALWKQKIKNLYPGTDTALLPSGFRISITDITSLAELLNAKKYPDPKAVMAYFTFDTPGAADSGKITATFVPVYDAPFSPCKKGCKSGQSFNEAGPQNQTINIDITQPCPPLCEK